MKISALPLAPGLRTTDVLPVSRTDDGQTRSTQAVSGGALLALRSTLLLTLTSSHANIFVATATDGVVQPNGTDIVFIAPSDRIADHGGVSLEIAGFNPGDSRQVLREDGAQIEAGAWKAGQRCRAYFDGAYFRLVEPARAAAGAGSSSEYQRIALHRLTESAAVAQLGA